MHRICPKETCKQSQNLREAGGQDRLSSWVQFLFRLTTHHSDLQLGKIQSIFSLCTIAKILCVLTMHPRNGKDSSLPSHSKQVPPETYWLEYLQFVTAPRWLKRQRQLRTSTVEKRPESEKGQFQKPYSLNPKYSNTRVVKRWMLVTKLAVPLCRM